MEQVQLFTFIGAYVLSVLGALAILVSFYRDRDVDFEGERTPEVVSFRRS